jgi:hypothetical protein
MVKTSHVLHSHLVRLRHNLHETLWKDELFLPIIFKDQLNELIIRLQKQGMITKHAFNLTFLY